jgi:hypothetical protein
MALMLRDEDEWDEWEQPGTIQNEVLVNCRCDATDLNFFTSSIIFPEISFYEWMITIPLNQKGVCIINEYCKLTDTSYHQTPRHLEEYCIHFV